jgi:hypothetical protein
MEEMRHLLGVGVQLKEQKVVDHRPRKTDAATTTVAAGTAAFSSVAPSEEVRATPVTANQTIP